MNKPEIYTKSLNKQHDDIMNRIADEYPTNKIVLLSIVYLRRFLLIFCISVSLIISVWFLNNLINYKLLLKPSLTDISGIEWIWSPELFGFAVLSYLIGYSLQRSFTGSIFRFVGFSAVLALAVFVNIIFYTPTTLAFQSYIQPDFNKLGYRIFSRDNHINALLEKDVFYGIVISQNGNNVEINHGGVTKSFVLKSCDENLLNKPIEIQFEKLNNTPTIRSFKVLT
jgi:hypothetical protein